MTPAALLCRGCGCTVAWNDPQTFRCPRAETDAGADIDHVLVRPSIAPLDLTADVDEPQPFVRFRRQIWAYHRLLAAGLSDAEVVALIRRLDAQVAAVDGRGFHITPTLPSPSIARQLGLPVGCTLWCKDETSNVSGSHKGRHLFGLLLELHVADLLQSRRVGERAASFDRAPFDRAPLAIASCGNAALAAAVLAKAVQRPLQVFIPPDAAPSVQARLRSLGADVRLCPRTPTDPNSQTATGDPTYLAFRAAVAQGAVPFCCQGPDNGLVIQGGQTLVYELLSTLGSRRERLRHVFVQVGGGALLSAVVAALQEAVDCGLLPALPRIYAVQTRAVAPLWRAYLRLLQHLSATADPTDNAALLAGLNALQDRHLTSSAVASDSVVIPARLMAEAAVAAQQLPIEAALQFARQHRHQFMWPWTVEGAAHSLAHGILDDETYDFAQALQGLLRSGGFPILVGEAALAQARDLARSAGFARVDATGAAGLSGLLTLAQNDVLSSIVRDGEDVAVLLTGAER